MLRPQQVVEASHLAQSLRNRSSSSSAVAAALLQIAERTRKEPTSRLLLGTNEMATELVRLLSDERHAAAALRAVEGLIRTKHDTLAAYCANRDKLAQAGAARPLSALAQQASDMETALVARNALSLLRPSKAGTAPPSAPLPGCPADFKTAAAAAAVPLPGGGRGVAFTTVTLRRGGSDGEESHASRHSDWLVSWYRSMRRVGVRPVIVGVDYVGVDERNASCAQGLTCRLAAARGE